MNENIDLTKILDGCPKGTKFFSSIYGDVLFIRITRFNQIQTRRVNSGITLFNFGKNGKLYDYEDAECTLFPSSTQRDWSKFERFWDKPKFRNNERWHQHEIGSDDIDNLNPSCRMCNYYKRMNDLETFRNNLSDMLMRNVRRPFDYRLALKYGLVKENVQKVKFYYEKAKK